MKKVDQKLFPAIALIPLLLPGYISASTIYGNDHVSAMQVKPISEDDKENLYRVACDNGKQHTIMANITKQDFQYHYPDKGYFIKYYDIGFEDLYAFADWVCRNK